MHTGYFQKVLACGISTSAMAIVANAHAAQESASRVLPNSSQDSILEHAALSIGLYHDALSPINKELYTPRGPGVQIVLAQNLKTQFEGSAALRSAYWLENKSTQKNASLIPIAFSTRVVFFAFRGTSLEQSFNPLGKFFFTAGPGAVFFQSTQSRELPGRSYSLEAGLGIYFPINRFSSLRVSHHYWRTAKSLGIKSQITSLDIAFGNLSPEN